LDQHLLLKKLNLELPQQPPPRIETAEAKESWEGACLIVVTNACDSLCRMPATLNCTHRRIVT
ncbi:MAG: hypothetical protein L0387_12740, partial [Acidobacteria bacterium]|nr:hypothetical protein [Acidobacteriota bacterium]